MPGLTLERLQEVLEYNPESGVLIWKIVTSRRVCKGAIAGSLDNNGYIVVRIDTKIYKVHRLAWMLMTGDWPKETIDHINNVPSDNRWTNLREATYSQNNANRGITSRNTSGIKGVRKSANGKRWMAHTGTVYLGTFDTPEEARAVFSRWAEQRWGNFMKL